MFKTIALLAIFGVVYSSADQVISNAALISPQLLQAYLIPAELLQGGIIAYPGLIQGGGRHQQITGTSLGVGIGGGIGVGAGKGLVNIGNGLAVPGIGIGFNAGLGLGAGKTVYGPGGVVLRRPGLGLGIGLRAGLGIGIGKTVGNGWGGYLG